MQTAGPTLRRISSCPKAVIATGNCHQREHAQRKQMQSTHAPTVTGAVCTHQVLHVRVVELSTQRAQD
eukprot:1033421-Rhodomonas_salina.1